MSEEPTQATTTTETAQDMKIDTPEVKQVKQEENGSKRSREETEEAVDGESKKVKLEEEEENDKSVKKEKLDDSAEGGEADVKSGPVDVGSKSFGSSVEMFDYFYKFLHFWPPNLDANKYEHLMLLDLLKKGHSEPDKKIGGGIKAFQVRYHPVWKSRCFFLVREDNSADDFSFRKCVDHILPLPEDMKVKFDVNKALGGRAGGGKSNDGGGGRGRGWGRGRGRGGKWRN